ncbi:tRNA (guanine(10)-N(2))-dimethyltransferase [Candidatus Micrarchaeota archaeon]|nr:tRNA (guanine(10)-N(2))-dimethyltransferase [Candidatus Micrarchaeota archaeon]
MFFWRLINLTLPKSKSITKSKPNPHRSKALTEEGVVFSRPDSVFYNPNMTFCRTLSSLAVGAIGSDLEIVDGFSASGIRSIRYGVENKNVSQVTFVDIDPAAIKSVKANAKKNKIKSVSIENEFCKVAQSVRANFVELDPFGTPAPYLYDSMKIFGHAKEAYISATATDVAVLCGGVYHACMKNYHAKPLNCEFTHEVGLRILVKKVAQVASEFNFGTTPLVSFSDQHYLKTIVKLTRNSDSAVASLDSFGHLWYCKTCANRGSGKFPLSICPKCNSQLDFAGPLYLGDLSDSSFLDKMLVLNENRKYSNKVDISSFLQTLKSEVGLPPYYYSVHWLCKILGLKSVPKFSSVLSYLQEKGYLAVRTHFSDVCVKTNAPFEVVCLAVSESSKLS